MKRTKLVIGTGLIWAVAICGGYEIGRHAHGPGSFGFVWAVACLAMLGAAECTRLLYRGWKRSRYDRELEHEVGARINVARIIGRWRP
jgi:hypothetical protein